MCHYGPKFWAETPVLQVEKGCFLTYMRWYFGPKILGKNTHFHTSEIGVLAYIRGATFYTVFWTNTSSFTIVKRVFLHPYELPFFIQTFEQKHPFSEAEKGVLGIIWGAILDTKFLGKTCVSISWKSRFAPMWGAVLDQNFERKHPFSQLKKRVFLHLYEVPFWTQTFPHKRPFSQVEEDCYCTHTRCDFGGKLLGKNTRFHTWKKGIFTIIWGTILDTTSQANYRKATSPPPPSPPQQDPEMEDTTISTSYPTKQSDRGCGDGGQDRVQFSHMQ